MQPRASLFMTVAAGEQSPVCMVAPFAGLISVTEMGFDG
jgi:hypothetical protein